jgi:hypothetical protein
VSKWDILINSRKKVTRRIPAAQDEWWSWEDDLLWPPLSLWTQLWKGWTSQMFLIEFKSNDNPRATFSLPMSLQICQQNGACSLQHCSLHMKTNTYIIVCWFSYAPHHEDMVEWRYSSLHSQTMHYMASFMPWPLCSRERRPSINRIGGQDRFRPDLDETAKINISAPTRNWTHILHFRA